MKTWDTKNVVFTDKQREYYRFIHDNISFVVYLYNNMSDECNIFLQTNIAARRYVYIIISL